MQHYLSFLTYKQDSRMIWLLKFLLVLIFYDNNLYNLVPVPISSSLSKENM